MEGGEEGGVAETSKGELLVKTTVGLSRKGVEWKEC